MNSSTILFAVALIAFSCITFTHSIKCYSCETKDKCRKAKQLECNTDLADATRTYLDFHHIGVNMSTTSPFLECFREEIKSNAGEFQYKGCIYSNIKGCSLILRPIHTTGDKRYCNQCNNKDGCNPAGRVNTDVYAVVGTIVAGLIGRYLWA